MKNKKLFISAIAAIILVVLMAAPTSALIVLDDMEDIKNFSGATLTEECKEGESALTSTSANTVVITKIFPEPIDISDYINDGGVRIWIYVSDVTRIATQGQLELTSSGTCDNEETSWNIPYTSLKNGWNEMKFRFDMAGENAADYTAINYMRFYIHASSELTIILDEAVVGKFSEIGLGYGAVTNEPVLSPEDAESIRHSDEGGGETYPQQQSDTDPVDSSDKPVPDRNMYITVGLIITSLGVAIVLLLIFTKHKKA